MKVEKTKDWLELFILLQSLEDTLAKLNIGHTLLLLMIVIIFANLDFDEIINCIKKESSLLRKRCFLTKISIWILVLQLGSCYFVQIISYTLLFYLLMLVFAITL